MDPVGLIINDVTRIIGIAEDPERRRESNFWKYSPL